jgi:S-(hydroxymethyl)glutathione dehydrogenase/alcohol dehydrogenase
LPSQNKLVGTVYGSADVRTDLSRLLRFWKAGRLDLEGMITKRASLEDVNTAFAGMQEGRVIRTVLHT